MPCVLCFSGTGPCCLWRTMTRVHTTACKRLFPLGCVAHPVGAVLQGGTTTMWSRHTQACQRTKHRVISLAPPVTQRLASHRARRTTRWLAATTALRISTTRRSAPRSTWSSLESMTSFPPGYIKEKTVQPIWGTNSISVLTLPSENFSYMIAQ